MLRTSTCDKFPTEPNKSAVSKQHVGVNFLKSILPDLSEKSGSGVRYTNQSLHTTAITRMLVEYWRKLLLTLQVIRVLKQL